MPLRLLLCAVLLVVLLGTTSVTMADAPGIAIDPIIASRVKEHTPAPVAAAACEGPGYSGAPIPGLYANAWVVYDPSSERVLLGKDEHERNFPASITKIATALVAMDRVDDMGEEVIVDVDWSQRWSSSRLGILPGMRTTLGDLFVGMLTVSGNDAADEIAEEVAGGEEAFADLMNAKAASLGLKETHFENSHGLDEAGHYSTAYDLAVLAAEAMKYDQFRQAVGSTHTQVQVDGEYWSLANTNPLLPWYEGATGIKTGTTAGSGSSLAASATRNGHELIAVVLGSPDRGGEAASLLDWAFANYTWNC
jgi:serine-type D-Ala-D-Ala carboxypeptidase (penicillin-binding protein 5/6)